MNLRVASYGSRTVALICWNRLICMRDFFSLFLVIVEFMVCSPSSRYLTCSYSRVVLDWFFAIFISEQLLHVMKHNKSHNASQAEFVFIIIFAFCASAALLDCFCNLVILLAGCGNMSLATSLQKWTFELLIVYRKRMYCSKTVLSDSVFEYLYVRNVLSCEFLMVSTTYCLLHSFLPFSIKFFCFVFCFLQCGFQFSIIF